MQRADDEIGVPQTAHEEDRPAKRDKLAPLRASALTQEIERPEKQRQRLIGK
jgi:hypothetical protein